MVERTGANRPATPKRVRAFRHIGECARMVLGLVRRTLLSRFASAQSQRPEYWNAPILTGWFVAASDQDSSRLRPQQHPARFQIQRLWLSLCYDPLTTAILLWRVFTITVDNRRVSYIDS